MKKAVIILFVMSLAATAFAFVGCGGGDGGSPEQVVETFLKASTDGDADAAYEQITKADQAEIANKEELVEGFAEGVESYDVGEATISGDTARVALNLRLAGSGIDLEFDMVLTQENGSWKVSLSDTETEMQKAFDKLMQEYEIPE
jgi:hypothetical protein